MVRDLNVPSSTKATILTENDDVPGFKLESEPTNYIIIMLSNLNADLSVGALNKQEKGKTCLVHV